jgi:hypothetical protein
VPASNAQVRCESGNKGSEFDENRRRREPCMMKEEA